ncbi:MAG: DUF3106 domain-containing protein [Candidatus Acidoferrales bacterium]
MRLGAHKWMALAVAALSGALAAADPAPLLGAGLPGQQPPPNRRQQVEPRQGEPQGPGARERAVRELFMRVAPLPPDEQRRALESSPLFQQLPPMARQRFEQRLAQFNALPPERRRERLERFQRAAWAEQAAQALFLRLGPLPPEQQERVLRNDEFFQRLPPPAQQRFRRHLEQFNTRPPEERQRILQRFQRFAELSPQEQQRLRRRARQFAQMSPEQRRQAQRIFQAWQQLPPERRRLIAERLRRLHQAPPEARARLTQEPQFLGPLRENERHLLRGLWQLRQHLPPPQGRPSH